MAEYSWPMAEHQRLRHGDVEGLRVGRFGGKVNTTCILWRIGDTLIDTGPPSDWRPVRRFAGERSLRRVVVTHHHEDHAGNLARLAAPGTAEILGGGRVGIRFDVLDGLPFEVSYCEKWGGSGIRQRGGFFGVRPAVLTGADALVELSRRQAEGWRGRPGTLLVLPDAPTTELAAR